MKTILLLIAAITCTSMQAQNVSLNILARNSGKVSTKETVMLEITVCNTDAAVKVPAYKLRPQISVPASIAVVAETGHTLPAGWSIASNKTTQIWLSNGTDTIAAGDCRTILIAIKGTAPGGPFTISGNLLFSNGIEPGNATGSSLPGDSPGDNNSTSTIEVKAAGKK